MRFHAISFGVLAATAACDRAAAPSNAEAARQAEPVVAPPVAAPVAATTGVADDGAAAPAPAVENPPAPEVEANQPSEIGGERGNAVSEIDGPRGQRPSEIPGNSISEIDDDEEPSTKSDPISEAQGD